MSRYWEDIQNLGPAIEYAPSPRIGMNCEATR